MRTGPPSWSVQISAWPLDARRIERVSARSWPGEVTLSPKRITPAARPSRRMSRAYPGRVVPENEKTTGAPGSWRRGTAGGRAWGVGGWGSDRSVSPRPPQPASSITRASVHTMRVMARVGILTGGGGCPGLNAVIRGVVRKAVKVHGNEAIGFRYGWAGVVEGDAAPLDLNNTSGILPRGGTILGSSRTNPYAMDGAVDRIKETLAVEAIDMLIPIGGEDTLGVARRLHDEDIVNIVGVPKTIDNDLSATDFTFGFQTAVQIVTDAIDRLHTTAESHNRVMVVEVMGRSAGHIALWSGMAGGADAILVPERPFEIERVVEHIQ